MGGCLIYLFADWSLIPKLQTADVPPLPVLSIVSRGCNMNQPPPTTDMMIDDWRKRAREKENNVVEELLVSHASYCIRYLEVFLFRLFRDREKASRCREQHAGPFSRRVVIHFPIIIIHSRSLWNTRDFIYLTGF